MAKARLEPWRSLSRAWALSHSLREDWTQLSRLGSGSPAPRTLGQAACSARAARVLGCPEAAGVPCPQCCEYHVEHTPWRRGLWATTSFLKEVLKDGEELLGLLRGTPGSSRALDRGSNRTIL